MKILNEYLSYKKVCKEIEIETDSGEILNLCKWVEYSDDDYDADWEWTGGSKKDFELLSEEEQEKVTDFIMEIEI